ncbi:hypothetical protein D1007_49075 [Hordeum vulgare]|nr:hypothetical protein D1007_49075 [Hordeum vulgare]
MTDADDASGSKDNAEGSKDTGSNDFPKHTATPQQNQPHPGNDTGPNNTIVHRDLRFGAFDSASTPAKFGSRAESPRLPRFAGKTSRIFKGSVQPNSALKPLSLEEYLLGAKATSTTLPIVPGAPVTSASAGLMEVCTADGLGHPTGQPQVADLCSQRLANKSAAFIGHAAAPAGVEESTHEGLQCGVVPVFELPSSVASFGGVLVHGPTHVEAAALACGGAVATARAGETIPKLAMHEVFNAGEGSVAAVPQHAIAAAQVVPVDALASAGVAGAALLAAQPDDVVDVCTEGTPMAGTESSQCGLLWHRGGASAVQAAGSFDLVSSREGGDPCTRSWMEFSEQMWVKTCSWLDAKAGDGDALRRRSLLEGIAEEKF